MSQYVFDVGDTVQTSDGDEYKIQQRTVDDEFADPIYIAFNDTTPLIHLYESDLTLIKKYVDI